MTTTAPTNDKSLDLAQQINQIIGSAAPLTRDDVLTALFAVACAGALKSGIPRVYLILTLSLIYDDMRKKLDALTTGARGDA